MLSSFLVSDKNTKEKVPRVYIHIPMVPPQEDNSSFQHYSIKDFDAEKLVVFLKS